MAAVKETVAARCILTSETMERVLGGTDKIILDSKGGQSVLPYMTLEQLRKP